MRHLIPELEAMKARLPAGFESSLVLPCLRRVQEERGYVADSDIDEMVEYLGVPRIQIEEVLSFYTQFRRRPIGRWHLQTCHNVSCSLRGAERVLDHLKKRLGIAPGETTADGLFTLVTSAVVPRLRHGRKATGPCDVGEPRGARPAGGTAWIAKNRHCLGGACMIPSHRKAK